MNTAGNGAEGVKATPEAEDGVTTFASLISRATTNGVSNDVSHKSESDGDDDGEKETEPGANSGDETGSGASDKEDSGSDGDSSTGDDSDSKEGEDKGSSVSAKGKEGADTKDLEAATREAGTGKVISLSLGDKQFKVPATAKFSFEKGGKKIDFTLDQAANNLLTKKEMDQEFSRLDLQKKETERRERSIQKKEIEFAEIEDRTALIKEAATKGDLFDIAQAVLNLFSDGDKDVTDTLLSHVSDLAKTVSGLSQEELASQVKTSQLSFKNKILTRDKEKSDSEAKRAQSLTQIQSLVSEHGIPWDEYTKNYAALKNADKKRIEMGRPPRLSPSMTLEQAAREVLVYTNEVRLADKVVGVIQKVNPSKLEDKEFCEAVYSLTDPKFSEKDIEDIVRELLGAPRKKKVSNAETSSKEVAASSAKSKDPKEKAATPKRAPEGKETKKDDDEEEGPTTFAKLKKRYS